MRNYKGIENGNAIDYYVDKGAISDKAEEDEEAPGIFSMNFWEPWRL